MAKAKISKSDKCIYILAAVCVIVVVAVVVGRGPISRENLVSECAGTLVNLCGTTSEGGVRGLVWKRVSYVGFSIFCLLGNSSLERSACVLVSDRRLLRGEGAGGGASGVAAGLLGGRTGEG